jgi:NADH:ubiquinone oxidoreductase subunit 4 (subunit M)
MFWIGLYPAPFFNLMAPAVNQLLEPIAKIITALP